MTYLFYELSTFYIPYSATNRVTGGGRRRRRYRWPTKHNQPISKKLWKHWYPRWAVLPVYLFDTTAHFKSFTGNPNPSTMHGSTGIPTCTSPQWPATPNQDKNLLLRQPRPFISVFKSVDAKRRRDAPRRLLMPSANEVAPDGGKVGVAFSPSSVECEIFILLSPT